MTREQECAKMGHGVYASKVVREGAFGEKVKRVYYCTFCGHERKSRPR